MTPRPGEPAKSHLVPRSSVEPPAAEMGDNSVCGFHNLPNELVDAILCPVCVASCVEYKKRLDEVFRTLSSVCQRWCQIIENKGFRLAVVEAVDKEYRRGFRHPYDHDPRLETRTFEGHLQPPSCSLGGDYFMSGRHGGFNDNIPYKLKYFVKRTDQSNNDVNTVKKQYTLSETITVKFPQPPTSSTVPTSSYIKSQRFCQYNQSFYFGYYCATRGDDPSPSAFVVLRLSPRALRDNSLIPGNDQPWPIKSDDVVAWTLPPHSRPIHMYVPNRGCYECDVSDRTGRVVIIDDINKRLIVFDENGNPLTVVLVELTDRRINKAIEVVARRDSDNLMQFIIMHMSTRVGPDERQVCCITVDRSSRSVSGDFASCPQYRAPVTARYDPSHMNRFESRFVKHLADINEYGNVILVQSYRGSRRSLTHQMVVLRGSDLRPIGSEIALGFRSFIRHMNYDIASGSFIFCVESEDGTPIDPVCCSIVRP